MKLIAARLLALMLWALFLVPHALSPLLALWRMLTANKNRVNLAAKPNFD